MSDTAPEGRPAPQFGQYATPEEQRARMGTPADPVAPPAPVEVSTARPDDAAAARPRLSNGRLLDRAVSVALLVYGVVSIVQTIPFLLDATRMLRTMGIEATPDDPAGLRMWGVAAVVVMTLGWLATAALTWRRARRGKTTFWIPILGGVVFTIVASFILSVPLVQDPAVLEGFLQLQESLG